MAPLHFLPYITDLASSSDLVSPLSLIGPILVPLDSAASSSLPSNASTYVYASSSTSSSAIDDVLSALNDGALKAVVSSSQLSELAGSAVDPKRLVLELESANVDSVSDKDKKAVGAVVVKVDSAFSDELDGALVEKLKTAFPTKTHELFLLPSPSTSSTAPPTQAVVKSLFSNSITLVIPSSLLSASSASTDSQISIPSAFLAPLSSDRPDSLYATMVTSSTHSSRPLGLVYSSNESISESILTGRGVYQSRKHGLWRKGESSGSTQKVVAIRADCDADAIQFDVVQSGTGFCHLETFGCFGSGELKGVAALEETLNSRMADAPEGSYTKRLFGDADLLRAKIMEEAEELCDAEKKEDVAFEAADLVYFAMVKCAKMGVSWKDVEDALDKKAQKVKRRKGDAKPKWSGESKATNGASASLPKSTTETPREPDPSPPPKASPIPAPPPTSAPTDPSAPIKMRTVPALSTLSPEERQSLLLRPVLDSSAMIAKVQPIITSVRTGGDKALASLTAQFDRQPLASQPEWSNVLLPPFSPESMAIPNDLKHAIDTSYANVLKFHKAQAETKPLVVETQPGVVCSRFARPITRVGLYVPGGTAILPSSAIMLGVPAQVAGCETIVLSTPPRSDGSISPEVLYVANLVGVTAVVKAGGAQAVAAMAYGTETVPKVDKIFGPGNQWVTAAKMVVQNDVSALVGIDMPAGPSEVLVRSSLLSFLRSQPSPSHRSGLSSL
jgi:phosphoribosyl-ATP pyrophosphohydrolase/phosphoribosyl-AMP cyclohydrolase/histidinol dehydrogenase